MSQNISQQSDTDTDSGNVGAEGSSFSSEELEARHERYLEKTSWCSLRQRKTAAKMGFYPTPVPGVYRNSLGMGGWLRI